MKQFCKLRKDYKDIVFIDYGEEGTEEERGKVSLMCALNELCKEGWELHTVVFLGTADLHEEYLMVREKPNETIL